MIWQQIAAKAAVIATPARRASSSERTVARAQQVLAGRRGGLRTAIAFGGPAVIASIAYMDPGNFATNIQAGAKYGYSLLWVVLLANIIAMLFQGLAAKLGIVTGRNLAELCRDRFPRPVVMTMWVVSEIAAMATDLAEFLGGALGLALLLHMPLLAGMVATGVITYGLLMCEQFGFRPLELVIGAIVGLICVCYLIEMFIAPINWSTAAFHTVTPQIADSGALLLAVGIIGATVMPHAIYLHSGLTQARVPVRTDDDRRTVLRFSNREVVIALSMAGLVNMAMVMMASSAFHAGHPEVAEIETAYHTLTPLLGPAAAGVYRDCAWRRADQSSGAQSGGVEHCAAAADDFAYHLHQSDRCDGCVHKSGGDPHIGNSGDGDRARSQRRSNLSNLDVVAGRTDTALRRDVRQAPKVKTPRIALRRSGVKRKPRSVRPQRRLT